MGSLKKFQDSISSLKSKGVLNRKDYSTLPQNNPQILTRNIEKLLEDPRVTDLPKAQLDALGMGLDKLERKKILRPMKPSTIEE